MVLRFLSLPLYLLSFLYLSPYVTCDDVKITTAQDLIDLSEKVLAGTNYSGTTIFLENDIDFTEASGNFKPIGNSANDFRGVFDGQGYKISNLNMDSTSSRHAGFFGYSQGGLAVRNLVLDGTCSITRSTTGSDGLSTFVGGIIGCCDANYGACISENNVNMAAVSFTGISDQYVYIGGTVGQFCPGDNNYEVTIRNCINYGDVSYSGTTTNYCYIGGVVGDLTRSTTTKTTKLIQNCINYGTVTSTGSVRDNAPFMGGVIGVSSDPVVVENCVNVGTILKSSLLDTHTGSVIGYALYGSNITHCYWTDGTGYDRLYGYKFPDESIVAETGNSQITIDAASVSTLNSYGSWNKWVYNTNSASVTFHINGGSGYTFTSQKLILLPSLAESTGRTFSGWYTDINCTNKLDEGYIIINHGNVDLYSGWKYTVSFNGNGGVTSQPNKDVVYGQHYGPLSGAVRTGYTFLGWYTASSGGDEVKSNTKVAITGPQAIYAQWTANTYTVTFDGNGISSQSTKNVAYDEPYGELPEATRTGYTFLGWYTDVTGGDLIESDTIIATADDHTLYAHWTANIYVVTFNENGGISSQSTKNVTYDEPYGELPEATRTGYTFIGWYTDVTGGDLIESDTNVTITSDQTLYAHWMTNNYTVTFKIDNKTTIEKVFPFNATIEYPKKPEKEGFMFVGWDKVIEFMPANNVTINALWNETTQFVEIVFNTKDMSKEQIEKIIEEYVGTDFTIVEYENKSGETRVIVKFNDVETAKALVEYARTDESKLFRAEFTTFSGVSYSFNFLPLVELFYLVL